MGEIADAAIGYLTVSFLGTIILFLLIFTTTVRQYRKIRKMVLHEMVLHEPQTNSKT